MKSIILLSIFIIFYINIDWKWKEFILFEQRKGNIHSKISEKERVKRYKDFKEEKEHSKIIFQENIIFVNRE